jgi:hypothetical protein
LTLQRVLLYFSNKLKYENQKYLELLLISACFPCSHTLILLLATVFTARTLLTGVISGTANDLMNETNYTVTATNTGTQITFLTDPANPADLTYPSEMSP